MPLENYHVAKIRNANDFKDDSFRNVYGGQHVFPGPGMVTVPDNILVLTGQLPEQTGDERAVVTLQFPVSDWTEEESKEWIADENITILEFMKAEKPEGFDDDEGKDKEEVEETQEKVEEERHIKRVEETDDEVIVTYGKSEEWEGVKIEVTGEEEEVKEEEVEEEEEIEYDYAKGRKKEKNNSNKKYEQRTFNNCEFRVQENKKDGTYIEGHAAIFNSYSQDLGGFKEIIEKNAFDTVLKDDVRALFNHDPNQILGRSTSGTLKLELDEHGLKYRIKMPNTTYANNLLESMKRGDVNQSSFGFIIEDDSWDENNEGEVVRTIKSVSQLFDISPVTYPAYEGTNTQVAQRKLDRFKQSKKQIETKKTNDTHDRNLRELRLKLIKTEL